MISTTHEGATNTVTAAKKAGIQRIVLTSSSSVLGPNWEPRPMTESDASDLEGAPDYFYRKRLQEEAAFECADREGCNWFLFALQFS